MENFPRDMHVGMNVYDRNHHHIGKVDDLKFPENAIDPDVIPADLDETDERKTTLMGTVAEAFGREPLPDALRDRLMREGYIHIEADGLFAANRYILPEQIATAGGDEITLNVDKDALIKR